MRDDRTRDTLENAASRERTSTTTQTTSDESDVHRAGALAMLLLRAAALFYDSLLIIALWFPVTAVAIAANDGEAIVHPLYRLGMLGVAWLFFDGFWRHGGQTLGMRAWRLKLVDDGVGPLTMRRTFLRFAAGCLLFGVTLVAMLFDARGRALHDRLSRTRVVRVAKPARRRAP